MTSPVRVSAPILVRFVLALFFSLIAITTQPVQAQNFTVIHNFTGGSDGSAPYAGVTLDQAGNLYGTTAGGGLAGQSVGAVYKMALVGSNWVTTPLYDFAAHPDGSIPTARVAFGPDGALYGTTSSGGSQNSGTVFSMTPPARPCHHVICPWTETILYSFRDGSDADRPYLGDLVFDAEGNIYGTTLGSDTCRLACGNVFKLTHSGGTWSESVLYTFSDGSDPQSGVKFDRAGNLYVTTKAGGANFTGSVYKLSPSGAGWTKETIYSFSFYGDEDGQHPYGGLTFDSRGNLYGTTPVKGPQGGGTVLKLTPSAGGWTFTLLHGFSGSGTFGPVGTLTLDAEGNVYGTCEKTGGGGQVFELSPANGSWTYTDLHDFSGPDGYQPVGGVTIDGHGNFYGTTFYGGSGDCYQGCGVAWEITP